jgi:plasmid stability protein
LKARAAANHRSLTGEVKAILTEATQAGRTPPAPPTSLRRRRLSLETVRVGSTSTFSREELYEDDGG